MLKSQLIGSKSIIDDVGMFHTLQHLLDLVVGGYDQEQFRRWRQNPYRDPAAGDSWDHRRIHIASEYTVLRQVDIWHRFDGIGNTLSMGSGLANEHLDIWIGQLRHSQPQPDRQE